MSMSPTTTPAAIAFPRTTRSSTAIPFAALPEIWAFGLRNPVALQLRRLDARRDGGARHRRRRAERARRNQFRARGPRRPQLRLAPARRTAGVRRDARPPRFCRSPSPFTITGATIGASITGGLIYRGAALDPRFNGRYFYADYVSGRVFSIGLHLDPMTSEATADDEREHTERLAAEHAWQRQLVRRRITTANCCCSTTAPAPSSGSCPTSLRSRWRRSLTCRRRRRSLRQLARPPAGSTTVGVRRRTGRGRRGRRTPVRRAAASGRLAWATATASASGRSAGAGRAGRPPRPSAALTARRHVARIASRSRHFAMLNVTACLPPVPAARNLRPVPRRHEPSPKLLAPRARRLEGGARGVQRRRQPPSDWSAVDVGRPLVAQRSISIESSAGSSSTSGSSLRRRIRSIRCSSA